MAQSRDDKIVEDVLIHLGQAILERSGFDNHWEEVAQLVLPTHKNTFFRGSSNMPGEKKTEFQIDSTATLALHRFMAICDSLLTPRNQTWHTLSASDNNLNKSRNVRLWFEQATRVLFKLRYAPTAGFAGNNQQIWRMLGAFGNGPMFVDKYLGNDGTRGFRYKAVPMGEVYLMENHQGIIDGFLRVFKMTARQVKQRIDSGSWKGPVPEQIAAKLEKAPETKFEFIHCVKPRQDVDPSRADYMGMEFASYYVFKEGKKLMSEGGYHSFPLPTARYDQEPGEVYGRGPAMMVLPSVKTLNAQKRIVLKQGRRTVDPVLLGYDDGIVDSISMRPGAYNKGGVNADGKPLVHGLPIGRVDVGFEMMEREAGVINDAFLVNLFQVLLDDPKVLTATQVIEMANEKGILLAPTVGRQADYLGMLIHREIDLAVEQGLLDPMPQELAEANGDYTIIYTSPLAKAARAQEAAGFMRTLESALEAAQAMQSPEPLDRFNFDVAIPEIADINGAPLSWMNDDRTIAMKRLQRAQQMQVQQEIQAGPAVAALMKAKAAQGAQ